MPNETTETVARRNQRRGPRRPRLRWLAVLLVVSAAVFCLVVIWHRDTRMHLVAMESTRQVQAWIEEESAQMGHLPFSVEDPLVRQLGSNPSIPYPDRDALYKLSRCTEPYVLFAANRQGLILPGGDGAPAIVVDKGKLRTVWLTPDQVDAARERREQILKGD